MEENERNNRISERNRETRKKIQEFVNWLFEQSIEITKEAIAEKLYEEYTQGLYNGYIEACNDTLESIKSNIILEIERRKTKLYESNFYNKPSEDAVIQMKAYEYLIENLGDIIKGYAGNGKNDH